MDAGVLYGANFWKTGDDWTVFDSSNITTDVTFEAGKTYLVLGTNTVSGGKTLTVTVAEVGAVIAAVNAWTMG